MNVVEEYNSLGSYSVYLAPNALLSEKLIQDAHAFTLHGVLGLTMTYIRCDYWMPRLRPLTKKVNHSVFGCRRFQAAAFQNPPPGNLPVECTTGSGFQVVGVDYASPISNKASSKRETRKAYQYILLFAEVFIKSFKQVIARRGRPQKVYFGDGRSFMTAARWLRGGEQGWRSGESTRLPPMWPGFDSRTRRHMWVEFVVGSLLCSERFFSGYSGFPLSAKTNISKFQFDPECSSV